jgi:hypothetical protein
MAACDGIPNHPDIIDPVRVNELETVAFPNVSSMQAHGWDTSSALRVSKGGSIGFGSCILTRTRGPERLTVAVVCNTSVGATRVATDVYNAVAAVGPVEEFYDLFYVIPYLPLDVVNP